MRFIVSLVAVSTALGVGAFAFLSAERTITVPALAIASPQVAPESPLRRPRGTRPTANSPRWVVPKRQELRERLHGWSKKARRPRLPLPFRTCPRRPPAPSRNARGPVAWASRGLSRSTPPTRRILNPRRSSGCAVSLSSLMRRTHSVGGRDHRDCPKEEGSAIISFWFRQPWAMVAIPWLAQKYWRRSTGSRLPTPRN
jgi:hypothetical protein